MRPRKELQKILETIAGSDRVYFQPPPKVTLSYPCIVYHKSGVDIQRADNHGYVWEKQYTVVVIDRNPDSEMPDEVLRTLPTSRFERQFTTDNLYHSVIEVYF